MTRWKFTDPLNHVVQRILANMRLFSRSVTPAVRASYFRALWNGVPNNRMMASMPVFRHTNCVFDCSSTAADSLEHYCRCSKLRPTVSGIPHEDALAECTFDEFFGIIKGLSNTVKICRALVLHLTLRLIHFARLHGARRDFNFWQLLSGRRYLESLALCPQPLSQCGEGWDPQPQALSQRGEGWAFRHVHQAVLVNGERTSFL